MSPTASGAPRQSLDLTPKQKEDLLNLFHDPRIKPELKHVYTPQRKPPHKHAWILKMLDRIIPDD